MKACWLSLELLEHRSPFQLHVRQRLLEAACASLWRGLPLLHKQEQWYRPAVLSVSLKAVQRTLIAYFVGCVHVSSCCKQHGYLLHMALMAGIA